MKTMILIPCMDMVHARFMRSLLVLDKVGDVSYGFHYSSLIYDARNQLLDIARQHNVDRVLWFDSDMDIPLNAMRILSEDLDNGYEIVSGLYFKRKPPYTPTIYSDCDVVKLDNDQLLPLNTPFTDYPKDQIFEVAAFGFGCVMMSMDAAKKVTDAFGMMPFMPTAGFGEDLSFCMRARKAGIRIWCDSRVRLGHIGMKVYAGESGE